MTSTVPARDERETILVVDDNAANRLLAEAILGSSGYTVRLAESGPKALESFAVAAPSLVLLDVLMPGMDGFETMNRLRALPSGAATPIMILTALSDLASVQRAIERGADDFVTKPINRTELLIRVSALIGRRKRSAAPSEGALALECADDAPAVARKRDEVTNLLVHDLKNPLTTIYFNAGLLKRDASLPAKSAEKVRRILRSSETLETMIMSVLDVALSADGSLPVRLASVDVASLLGDVVAAMEPQADLSQQRIELVTEGGPARIEADADLLRRMLENLIDNSTKYAPPESTIRVDVRSSDGSTEFRVQDEGPGVPAQLRDKIFDRYFQLEVGGARPFRRGRGLGLTSVRVAAETHGGRVWIEDRAGGGTCFCFAIPASRPVLSRSS